MLIATANIVHVVQDIPADKVVQFLKDANQFFMNAWYLLIGFAGLTPFILWFLQNRIAKTEENRIKENLKKYIEDKIKVSIDNAITESKNDTKKLLINLVETNIYTCHFSISNLALHMMRTDCKKEAIEQFLRCIEFGLKYNLDTVNMDLDDLINSCLLKTKKSELSKETIDHIQDTLIILRDKDKDDRYRIGIHIIEQYLCSLEDDSIGPYLKPPHD